MSTGEFGHLTTHSNTVEAELSESKQSQKFRSDLKTFCSNNGSSQDYENGINQLVVRSGEFPDYKDFKESNQEEKCCDGYRSESG